VRPRILPRTPCRCCGPRTVPSRLPSPGCARRSRRARGCRMTCVRRSLALKGVDRTRLEGERHLPVPRGHGFTGLRRSCGASTTTSTAAEERREGRFGRVARPSRARRATVFEPLGFARSRHGLQGVEHPLSATREKLEPAEWVKVLESIREIGPGYAAPPVEDASLAELSLHQGEAASRDRDPAQRPGHPGGAGRLPQRASGRHQFRRCLRHGADTFNQTTGPDLPRPSRSIGGRAATATRPRASGQRWLKILDSFRNGEPRPGDFWIELHGPVRFHPLTSRSAILWKVPSVPRGCRVPHGSAPPSFGERGFLTTDARTANKGSLETHDDELAKAFPGSAWWTGA